MQTRVVSESADRTDRKPNLTLIAQRCGVSKMTVSRVFRHDPHVAPSTRVTVLQAAERLSFVPSGRAVRGSAPAVRDFAVLFRKEYSLADAYFSEIIRTIQQELFERGCGCSFAVVSEQYPDFLKLNAMLKARSTRSVLLVGEIAVGYVNALLADYPGLVLVDYAGDPAMARPYNAIYPDQVHGAHLAVRHLLRLKRERILLLAGRQGHYFANDLLAGYRQVMAESNVALDPRLLVHTDAPHRRDGYRGIKRALGEGLAFDAVLANDEMACGALTALHEAGRRVPDDVAVVGFDGLPLGEDVRPALTTVRIDRQRMGRLAVARLLAVDEAAPGDAATACEKIAIFPELVIRESCGARAAAVPTCRAPRSLAIASRDQWQSEVVDR
jgi:DNA-binding LacI/PurR family transcriptional regulator